MDLGHFVTGGVTYLLPQALGHQRAMELMVLGDRIGASGLHALGLVNRVVPAEQMLAQALALAQTVASRSPGAVAALKRVLTLQGQSQLAAALELERQAAMDRFADPDTAQRVHGFTSRRL